MLTATDIVVRSHADPRVSLVDVPSINLAAGSITTLVGESGSGKSLLLAALMGTLPAGLVATGEIDINGTKLRLGTEGGAAAQRRAWGRGLALIPQEPWVALDPTMQVAPQVAEVWRDVRAAGRDAPQRARESLQRVGLGDAEAHYPHMLSGGMAQRVVVAATMATGAPIVLADEPTKGLDADACVDVVALLLDIAHAGGAVLVVTHDLAVARALGGRLAVMKSAEIVEEGPCERLLQSPQHAYTRALMAADPTHWSPATTSGTDHPVVVEANSLTLRREQSTLMQGVNLTVGRGEWHAVVGPSGSGKTTLGDALLGIFPVASGEIRRYFSRPLAAQKLYQDPIAAFAPRVTLSHGVHHLAKRFGVAQSRLDALLHRLSLQHSLLRRLPSEVSGGELQRIALLRLALIQPEFVFADEPTSRLDLILQQQTLTLMRELFAGAAVLLVTHDRAVARGIAARVTELRG